MYQRNLLFQGGVQHPLVNSLYPAPVFLWADLCSPDAPPKIDFSEIGFFFIRDEKIDVSIGKPAAGHDLLTEFMLFR